MERQEVVNFILTDAKRLNEEEHIHDLNKAGRYEELSRVESKIIRPVLDYLLAFDVELCESEIPEGHYLAVAIWTNTIGCAGVIKSETEFADKLAEEAGALGKSIAYKVKEDSCYICYMNCEEFFDITDADKYDCLMI